MNDKGDKQGDVFPRNYAHTFNCKGCDFKCCKPKDWSRHIATHKHKRVTPDDNFPQNVATPQQHEKPPDKLRICQFCSKTYKYRQGLHRHKQKCPEKNVVKLPEISTELVLQILKDTNELKELIIDQNNTIQDQHKTIIELVNNNQVVTTNNNTNNSTHTQNKTFNLQFFLNETCKDAMNLSDFVNSIKQQFSDLEYIENNGYVKGISNIFIKNLKALKQEVRPMHCTDEKRKVIYVKNNNIWEKEDATHASLRRAIKNVSKGSFMLMNEFKKMYTDWDRHDSRTNTRYHKLMLEVLGGSGKEDADNESKIITNISREIRIQK